MIPLRLHPDDLAALAGLIVDGVVDGVTDRLRDGLQPTPRVGQLIDAAEVARRHSVDRAWVYAHADELGAVRLGDGPRPRLRFDPERVACSLSRSAVEPASRGAAPNARGRPRARAGTKGSSLPTGAPLLPIRGDGRRAA